MQLCLSLAGRVLGEREKYIAGYDTKMVEKGIASGGRINWGGGRGLQPQNKYFLVVISHFYGLCVGVFVGKCLTPMNGYLCIEFSCPLPAFV